MTPLLLLLVGCGPDTTNIIEVIVDACCCCEDDCDTGDTHNIDTGDTGDTGDTAEDALSAEAQSRKAASDAVLARGVLPADVVAILSARQSEE